MAELTEAAEAVEEIVEEVVEAVKLPNVKLIAASAFVAGAAVGVGAAYFFAKRQLETKYAQIAESEVEDMRRHFQAKEIAREPKPDLKDLAGAHDEEIVAVAPVSSPVATARVQYGSPEEVIVGDKPVPEGSTLVRDVPEHMKDPNYQTPDDQAPVKSHYKGGNVFNDPPPQDASGTWDYATETKLRLANDGAPFVIHRDEVGEKDGWDMVTITYYAGDDVLANERDEEMQDRDTLIGAGTLERFGHGSNDPMVVLVRNPAIEQEFEIVRSDGKYVHEVMGHPEEDELRHSDMPRRRRPWDDA